MTIHQNPPSDINDDITLISRRDLKRFGIHYSNQQLLALERDGKFPRRVRLSPAKVAWVLAEVIAWIAAKAAARK